MTFFSDIGKPAKDILTGGYNYDHKVSVNTKTGNNVDLSSNYVLKGDTPAVDFKTTCSMFGKAKCDTTLSNTGSIKLGFTFDDIMPGLKATVNGSVPDVNSGSMAVQYVKDNLGMKASMGIGPSPKMDMSVGFGMDALALGGEAAYDTVSGSLTKYGVGVQYKMDDLTMAVGLADKLDTATISAVHYANKDWTVAGDITRKLSSGANTFSLGASTKTVDGATAKATVDSNGLLSAMYTTKLNKSVTMSACSQMDTKSLSKPVKLGFQLAMKP